MDRTLYIFFGLIASGKSTLAELFAATYCFPYYNTDRIRKELVGIAATERRPDAMGKGIYRPEFTEKTYQVMSARVTQSLHNGAAGVVLDGSYSRKADRQKVRDLADSFGALALFILCSCSDRETRRRLDLRAEDPNAVSDGRWEIFVQQKEKFEPPDELPSQLLLHLDTEAAPADLLKLLEHTTRNIP